MTEDQNRGRKDWNSSYARGHPPWDLDGPPPVLQEVIDEYTGTSKHVFVPCAGLGHGAIAWAAAGHCTVAVDFAPLAVERACALAKAQAVKLEVREGDLRLTLALSRYPRSQKIFFRSTLGYG